MHDTIIGATLLKELEKYGNITQATIQVGELYGIEPDHLLEHLAEVSKIKFKVEKLKSKVECACGYCGRAHIIERLHDMVLFDCPKCGSDVKVIEGDKLLIKEVKRGL